MSLFLSLFTFQFYIFLYFQIIIKNNNIFRNTQDKSIFLCFFSNFHNIIINDNILLHYLYIIFSLHCKFIFTFIIINHDHKFFFCFLSCFMYACLFSFIHFHTLFIIVDLQLSFNNFIITDNNKLTLFSFGQTNK